jgi:flagellar assembly protein FliH
LQQASSTSRKSDSGRIEAFEYPAGPGASQAMGWYGWAEGEAAADKPGLTPGKEAADESAKARHTEDFEKKLAEEAHRAFEEGRAQGIKAEREAQAAARAVAEREPARQAAKMIEEFARERDRYMQTVEHEVVMLALAVAARILRREAQMDPLLLTGAVRVALGQLSSSTQVRLRVPPSELDLWTEAMALVPNLAVRPTVMAGEEMRLGDCTIETEMGSVDLGIRAQLGEIERGFFDRAVSAGTAHGDPDAGEMAAAVSAGQEKRA